MHFRALVLKTAREIKDLQLSLPGERFPPGLEQLKSIKRVDWERFSRKTLSVSSDYWRVLMCYWCMKVLCTIMHWCCINAA